MTKVKMCGLTSSADIRTVNELMPDFIGFVFARKSKRFVTFEKAKALRAELDPGIKAAGVFVDEDINTVAELLDRGIIDIAQLHGNEDDDYIVRLKAMTHKTVIKAFRISTKQDAAAAQESPADLVLLDAGAGGGVTFDWSLVSTVERPYFLAGGLSPENAAGAVAALHPFALDVSSGIETDGHKDKKKMAAFIDAVRKEDDR